MDTNQEWDVVDDVMFETWAESEQARKREVIAHVQAWIDAQEPLPDPYAPRRTSPIVALTISLAILAMIAGTLLALVSTPLSGATIAGALLIIGGGMTLVRIVRNARAGVAR